MKTLLGVIMFKIYHQLPRSSQEIEDHLDALESMTSDNGNKALIEHLYGTLTVLDVKATSMLAFNGIMVAAYVIYLSSTNTSDLQFTLANLGTLIVLLSSVIQLSVVWVHWSSTDDLLAGRSQYVALVKVRAFRARAEMKRLIQQISLTKYL